MPSERLGDEPADGAVSQGKYGDAQIDPGALDNSYQKVGDDLKAKLHPNGRIYLRVRDGDDGRRWNEFSIPLEPDLGVDFDTADPECECPYCESGEMYRDGPKVVCDSCGQVKLA